MPAGECGASDLLQRPLDYKSSLELKRRFDRLCMCPESQRALENDTKLTLRPILWGMVSQYNPERASVLRLKAIMVDELSIFDIPYIASKSQIAKTSGLDVVKEALREGYAFIRYCAQIPFFVNWDDPEDYHWFYAYSFRKPWFSAELWSRLECSKDSDVLGDASCVR
ncbi:hypothetical protein PSACC_02034 [Paramicrosporidium saccamoebae]|uniref:Uncharacterized protein n=1 Tax=Paramicrosporidium saccamoebae TaxID=1246581 RepID=A0A2H9TKA2_9FUNG|nr:hypothetical protein PSACC_02034 [Paramicrosporidium saccamoebae]